MATKCIVLGQTEKPKKELKPIEFIKYHSREKAMEQVKHINETVNGIQPRNWDCIELVCKSLNERCYDIMFAYDNGKRDKGIVFFGYWNDGVVEE